MTDWSHLQNFVDYEWRWMRWKDGRISFHCLLCTKFCGWYLLKRASENSVSSYDNNNLVLYAGLPLTASRLHNLVVGTSSWNVSSFIPWLKRTYLTLVLLWKRMAMSEHKFIWVEINKGIAVSCDLAVFIDYQRRISILKEKINATMNYIWQG